MGVYTRPATSVIDYTVPGGDSTEVASQKQDIAIDAMFTNIKAATESVTGLVELATTAECATGTATDVVGTPAGIQANFDAQVSAFGKTLVDDADAATARTTLGLGTMANQGAGAVAITGGSVTGITDLAVADGGTGASDAAGARTNLDLYSTSEVDALIGLPMLYKAGLTVSNNSTDADHDLDIAAGTCRDTTNAATITLSSGMTKLMDAEWEAGDGNGGMRGSATYLAANNYVRLYVISKADGTSDVMGVRGTVSLNLPTGYVYYRRIGTIPTDASANFVGFTQVGNTIWLTSSVRDVYDTSPTTDSRTLAATTVPPGMIGHFVCAGQYTSSFGYVAFRGYDDDDNAASDTSFTIQCASSGRTPSVDMDILTDSSRRIAYRSSDASIVVSVFTRGWTDLLED